MATKKQHYYPRALLKYFSNDDGKVNVYMRLAKDAPFKYVKYENVCAANYTYEGTSKDDELEIDNILEDKLSSLEGKLTSIIDKIIKSIKFYENREPTVDINEDDIEFLFKYMNLQYIRTDMGRINFINAFRECTPRKYPMKLEEIHENKRKIREFNNIFKKPGILDKFMDTLKVPEFMNFHISIGKYFITSDNPVVGTDNWKQMWMPISQNLCLEFLADEFNHWGDNIIIPRMDRHSRYFNEAQIETANYYIISKDKFDLPTQYYIYLRYFCPDWEKKSRHFKD